MFICFNDIFHEIFRGISRCSQELGIPVHYASEEADNTRLGTSGPAVRAIVKEGVMP